MKHLDFYFDVLDGKESLDPSLFAGEPEAQKADIIFDHAFAEIIDRGNKDDILRLLTYLDDDIHAYSYRKLFLLLNLNSFATDETELLLLSYMKSEHPDLRDAAFFSLSELAKRKVISGKALVNLVQLINRHIKHRSFTLDEVYRAVTMLQELKFADRDALIELAKNNYPEVVKKLDGSEDIDLSEFADYDEDADAEPLTLLGKVLYVLKKVFDVYDKIPTPEIDPPDPTTFHGKVTKLVGKALELFGIIFIAYYIILYIAGIDY